MKKVGIVSCYFKNNYGSILQAYATKKILDNHKIPNETINIDNNTDFKKGKRKYYLSQLFNFNFIKSKFGMIKLKLDKRLMKNLRRNLAIRDKKYKEFRKEFNLSGSCQDYNSLAKMAEEKYTDIIVGSDQLWLPVNVVANYYTLNWVPDKLNKISYATSFGISTIPEKYKEQYRKFLKRINHLSVREESGVKLIKDISKLEAKLVADPTILLTKEEWDEVSVKKRIIKDKYILCYFLGNNMQHRKFVEKLKEKTGLKIVSLNHADEYVKYSDKFADIAPYDIGPKEWLNLIKNAEYVCTDSFHGTIFSILYNKMFFNFRRYKANNKMSTNTRIDSLLNMVGIDNKRILTGWEEVEEVLAYEIDYHKVNANINQFREESKKWLLEAIRLKIEEDKEKYIKIEEKEWCSGCTACYASCPQDAISMVRDKEGFLYPEVDKEKCINCGLCKKVCPILNKKETEEFEQKGYIFQYHDEKIRKESTSGGAFTAIAEYVLDRHGSVYGVAFDEEFNVTHQRITDKKDLYKFRNSKYVQSNPNETFKQVLKDLKEEKIVCYSGTACQIEGLKAFLKSDYDNLITVDVICRAVPSPLLWKKYFAYKTKDKEVKKVYFREKYYGYQYSNLTMHDEKGTFYHNGIETDSYLRAFFSNIACRPSCYQCHFKTQLHKADFTIWDCFDVDKFDTSFDDNIGTTRILINSSNGLNLFNEIKEKHKTKEIDVNQLVSNFHQMFHSIEDNARRTEFFDDLNKLEFNRVVNKYFPNTIRCKLEKGLRVFLIKIGIYKPLIRLGKKVRKRD